MSERVPREGGSFRRGRRRRWISGPTIAASVAIVLLFALWWYGNGDPTVDLDPVDPTSWEVPDPDTSGMEPRVAAQLQAAREAVVKAPGAAARWARFGSVLDIHALFDVAEICYRHAHRLEPDDFQWPYHLAIVLEAQGAPADEVVTWFREAAARNPGYVPVHIRMGKVLTAQGRLPEARAAYLQAIALDPGFAIAHRGLGQVLLGLGDPEQAVIRLERAAELAPNDAPTLAALSQGYHRLGDQQRAEEADERSRRSHEIEFSDPARGRVVALGRSSSLRWKRANQLIANGEFERALQLLKSFAEMHPEDPYAQLRLAYCYLRTGQADAARTHFSNALRLQETWEAAAVESTSLPIAKRELEQKIWHARCERLAFAAKSGQQQSLKQELAEFERAAEGAVLGDEPEVCWANALMNLEKAEQAVDHYRQATRLVPDRPIPHRLLGIALERLGRIDDAIDAYQQATNLNPNSPAADSLARLTAVGR